MSAVVTTVSSILSMLGSALEFVLDEPYLLALCIGIPLVGSLVGIVVGIFK